MSAFRRRLRNGKLYEIGASDLQRGRWEIVYDDDLAHERSELVEDSARAIAGLSGVAKAWNEDRELVIVEGSVSQAELVEWLGSWWDEALRRPAPWEAAFKAALAPLTKALKADGFRKRGSQFNRITSPELVHTVYLAADELSGRRFLDLRVGAFLPDAHAALWERAAPDWIELGIEHLRLPAAGFDAAIPERMWLDEPLPSPELLVEAVRQAFTSTLISPAEVLQYLRDQPIRQHEQLHAVLAAAAGLADEAQQQIQAFFDGHPSARTRAHALADKLGVELTTGRDPLNSLADDELLDAWNREAAHRRALLRSMIDEAAGRPVRLEPTEASLEVLWRWFAAESEQVMNDARRIDLPPYSSAVGSSPHARRPDAATLLILLTAAHIGDVIAAFSPGSQWVVSPDGLVVGVGGDRGSMPVIRKVTEALDMVIRNRRRTPPVEPTVNWFRHLIPKPR